MKKFVVITLLLLASDAICQTSYSGFVDKYPIELIIDAFSKDVEAIYAYDKYDTPIIINGKKKSDRVELYEKDAKGIVQARLVFKNFESGSEKLNGEWINRDSTKRLKITLTRKLDLDERDNPTWTNQEILQPASTDQHYFKLLISREDGGQPRVTGLKIIEKKTDRLIEQIALDCQLWGLENVSVGDYNFDGLKDISVFEQSYAGANTSSIYILRQPGSEKYVVSEFGGTSLEFDAAKKLITEKNVCCAGMSLITGTYKVVDNKMVLVSKKCFEYNESKQDYVEIKCK